MRKLTTWFISGCMAFVLLSGCIVANNEVSANLGTNGEEDNPVVFTDDFQDYSTNDQVIVDQNGSFTLKDWEIITSNFDADAGDSWSAKIVVDPDDANNLIWQQMKSDGGISRGKRMRSIRTFDPLDGVAVVEVKLKKSGRAININLIDNAGQIFTELVTTANGGFLGGKELFPLTGTTVGENQWYKVKIEMNFDAHTSSMYVDPTGTGNGYIALQLEDGTTELPLGITTANLSRIELGYYGAAGTVYMDDLVVFNTPSEVDDLPFEFEDEPTDSLKVLLYTHRSTLDNAIINDFSPYLRDGDSIGVIHASGTDPVNMVDLNSRLDLLHSNLDNKQLSWSIVYISHEQGEEIASELDPSKADYLVYDYEKSFTPEFDADFAATLQNVEYSAQYARQNGFQAGVVPTGRGLFGPEYEQLHWDYGEMANEVDFMVAQLQSRLNADFLNNNLNLPLYKTYLEKLKSQLTEAGSEIEVFPQVTVFTPDTQEYAGCCSVPVEYAINAIKMIAGEGFPGVAIMFQGRAIEGVKQLLQTVRLPDTPADSTVTPTTATFDKNVEDTSAGHYQDVVTTITPNGNTLIAVKLGETILTEGEDYSVSGNIVTLKREYLATLGSGQQVFTIDMSAGADPILTVTITDMTITDPLQAMRGLIDDYETADEINSVLATQLRYRLDIIELLVDQGDMGTASTYLQDFVSYIQDPSVLAQQLISEGAVEALREAASRFN